MSDDMTASLEKPRPSLRAWLESASPETEAVAEYFRLRAARTEARLKIINALEKVGLSWFELDQVEQASLAVEKAFRKMEHEDRMTVLTRESAEIDAVLRKGPRP